MRAQKEKLFDPAISRKCWRSPGGASLVAALAAKSIVTSYSQNEQAQQEKRVPSYLEKIKSIYKANSVGVKLALADIRQTANGVSVFAEPFYLVKFEQVKQVKSFAHEPK